MKMRAQKSETPNESKSKEHTPSRQPVTQSRSFETTRYGGTPFLDNRQEAVAQRELQQRIDSSPRQMEQAERLKSLFGRHVRREADGDERSIAVAQSKLQVSIDNSSRQVEQARRLSMLSRPAVQRVAHEGKLQTTADPADLQPEALEEKEPLQGELDQVQAQGGEDEGHPPQGKLDRVQRQEPEDDLLQGRFETSAVPAQVEAGDLQQENRTGMPDHLKAGLEQLSGMDLSDVQVHRNSTAPAQLNALAYAQGKEIHLGPGQEAHLPHESWHVVQQMQGRVRPTIHAEGMALNNDPFLEHEADVMGAKVAATKTPSSSGSLSPGFGRPSSPQKHTVPQAKGVAQGKMKANSFREMVVEQTGLQKAVKENPEPYKGRYTTAGFEHEFAVMTNGPLRGVSHLEIAKSQETFSYTGLPFILETDALNALELVSPPYLIETLPGVPLPDPDEVNKVDTETQKTLKNHIQTTPTLDLLIGKFQSDPGINFNIGDGGKGEGVVDIQQENMTPKTDESLNGSPISSSNSQVSEETLGSIELTEATSKSGKSSSTHVNFATDIQTYDLMQEMYTGEVMGDYDKYILEVENDLKEIMYQKAFKDEIKGVPKKMTAISAKREMHIALFQNAREKATDLLGQCGLGLHQAFLIAHREKREKVEKKTFTPTVNIIQDKRGEASNYKASLGKKFDAIEKELGSARATKGSLLVALKLLEEANEKAQAYNDWLGDDWLLNNYVKDLPDQLMEPKNKLGDIIDLFPIIGEQKNDKNIKIFLNILARTLSGQIGVVSQLTVKAAQEARFQDPNKPMKDLDLDQMLSSRVKDVHQVWIKDTIMNIGVGLLQAEDWARLKQLIKAGWGRERIKGKVDKYQLPVLKVKSNKPGDYGAEELNIQRDIIKDYMLDALDQIVSYIEDNNLHETKGQQRSIWPWNKGKGVSKEKIDLGVTNPPKLFEHDKAHIGARQDTYIPSSKVQMPDIWPDKRLHVVESRKFSVERLREIKEFYENRGSSSSITSFNVSFGFEPPLDSNFLQPLLEKGDNQLKNGYVIKSAQAQKLDEDNLENVDITPDGDCLFNSLIETGAYQGSVKTFRALIANAVRDEVVDVSGFNLDRETAAKDIRTLGSYNNWAGDATPAIIAQVLGIRIMIYNEAGNTTQLDPDVVPNGTYKLIRFTTPGKHYHATKPKEIVSQEDPTAVSNERENIESEDLSVEALLDELLSEDAIEPQETMDPDTDPEDSQETSSRKRSDSTRL